MATIKWTRAVVPRGIRTSAICISQSSHAPVLLTEPQVLLGLLLLFLWLTNEIKSDFSSTYNPLKYWNILPTELKIFLLSGFDWFRECNKTQSFSSSRAKPASNISETRTPLTTASYCIGLDTQFITHLSLCRNYRYQHRTVDESKQLTKT